MTEQYYRMWLDAAERARLCHNLAVVAFCRSEVEDAVSWQHMAAHYAKVARNLAGRE